MSVRRDVHAPLTAEAAAAHRLRNEIEQIRTQTMATECCTTEETFDFDDLNETEKSAATIGAVPESFKPIAWMNSAHYTTLLKKNALGGRLTQQIEAYKTVSSV